MSRGLMLSLCGLVAPRGLVALCGLVALLVSTQVRAGFDEDLSGLQQRWAVARYQTPVEQRKPALTQLIKEADALAEKNAGRADAWLWAAVVRGSYAEAANDLSALGIVKEAKSRLEKSIELDANVEDGYAYGVLGQMYAKVPGWPIAFGDHKKAKEYLQKGLAVAPHGMNTNYFYAQFLLEEGDYKQAQSYAEHALQAQLGNPPTLAESNRQREARELLEKIKAKVR